MTHYITPKDLASEIRAGKKVQVIDVRDEVRTLAFVEAALLAGLQSNDTRPCHSLAYLQVALLMKACTQDYAGLHIKGACNWPSGKWDEDTPEKLQASLPLDTERIVLHCALSQVRGPKAARKYTALLVPGQSAASAAEHPR